VTKIIKENQKENLQVRIENIKLAIESFSSTYAGDKHNYIEATPLSVDTIKDIQAYPEDYQMFLRELGMIYLATNDCETLVILSPQYEEQYPDDYGECGMWWGYTPQLFPCHARAGLLPCGYESVGFDLRSKPFLFTNFSDTKYSSFLTFVEEEFRENEHLRPHFKTPRAH